MPRWDLADPICDAELQTQISAWLWTAGIRDLLSLLSVVLHLLDARTMDAYRGSPPKHPGYGFPVQ